MTPRDARMPWTPADKPGDRPARSFSGYQLALVSPGSSGQLFGGRREAGKGGLLWLGRCSRLGRAGKAWTLSIVVWMGVA